MQTFLPFPDFEQSAKVLDKPRLQKQRVEGLQILAALRAPRSQVSPGWSNHPATVMWRDNVDALVEYLLHIHAECTRRKIADRANALRTIMKCHSKGMMASSVMADLDSPKPWWFGSKIHRSHRQSLLWKNPDLYAPFKNEFPRFTLNSPKPRYVWPFHFDEYEIESVKNMLQSKDSRLTAVINRYAKPRLIEGQFFKGEYGYEVYANMGRTPSVYLLQGAT